MNKFLTALTVMALFVVPGVTLAQVFTQSQVIIPPFYGLVVSTSTMFGAKLQATTSPTIGSLTATSTATSTFAGPVFFKDPILDVRSFGAKCDGVTDDASAIQNALDYALANSKTAYFPAVTCVVNSTINSQVSILMDASAVIKAGAAMSSVLTVGSSGRVTNGFIQGGTIDANYLANDGLFMRRYANFKVQDLTVKNQQVYAFHIGDSSLSPFTSYEAILTNDHSVRELTPVPIGSVGLFVDSTATDGNYSTSVFQGNDIGVRALSGGNFFTDIHAWTSPSIGSMTIAFDDFGHRNIWKGLDGDNPSSVAFHANNQQTIITGSRFFVNTTDNVASGMVFDDPTPHATVSDTNFEGSDNTHRLAQDIIASTTADIIALGNHDENVVLHNASLGNFLYNTADQSTTASEFASETWLANQFVLTVGKNGAGTNRNLLLQTAGAGTQFTMQGNSAPWFDFNRNLGTGGTPTVKFRNTSSGGLTAASGQQNFLEVDSNINQSGSAGYSTLVASTTEVSVGTGAHYPLELLLRSNDIFTVSSNGTASTTGAFYSATTTATSTFANGLNITGGCFATNGNCLSASSLGGVVPIASGGTATTTFYDKGIIFFNNSLGTLSQANNGNYIYDYTNNRLGLGTSTPPTQFVIQGTGTNQAGYDGTNFGVTPSYFTTLNGTSGSVNLIPGSTSGSRFNITGFSSAGVGSLLTNSSSLRTLQFGNAGSGGLISLFGGLSGAGTGPNAVGINATSTPFSLLSIAGSAGGTTSLFAISSSTSGFATSTALLVSSAGNLSLLNGANLTLSALATPAGAFLAVNANGQVIATTTPTGTNYFTLTGSNLQNNSGNGLGINAAPTIASLEVLASSTTASPFAVWGAAGGTANIATFSTSTAAFATTTAVSISSNGDLIAGLNGANLGLGTTSPYKQLSLARDSGGAAGAVTSNSGIVINDTGANTSTWDIVNPYAALTFSANDATGGAGPRAVVGAVSNTGNGQFSRLGFFLKTQSNTAPVELMSLAPSGSTGYLGIGTTTPNSKLSVSVANGANAFSIINSGNSNSAWGVTANTGDIRLYEAASGDFGAGTSRVAFQAGGNVGIGTTISSAKLDVSSAAAGQSIIRADGSMTSDASGIANAIIQNSPTVSLTQGSVFWGIYNLPKWSVDANINITAFNNIANDFQAQGTLFLGGSVYGMESHVINLGSGMGLTTWVASEYKDGAFSSPAVASLAVGNYMGIRVNPFTSGTSTTAGVLIGEMAGSGSNVDLTVGTVSVPTGNFGLYNSSNYNNYFKTNTGIGSTTPWANLSIAGTGSATVPLFAVASTTTTLPVFEIDPTGHVVTSGPKPTLSSCGTTNSISGNDNNGTIIFTGTLVTACTMTFATAVPASQTVECQASDSSTSFYTSVTATSTTAITFGTSATLSAGTIFYDCKRHQ